MGEPKPIDKRRELIRQKDEDRRVRRLFLRAKLDLGTAARAVEELEDLNKEREKKTDELHPTFDDHEFCTLYNDDRTGRCASETCMHRARCAICSHGQKCALPSKYIPFVSTTINVNGVIWLRCQSFESDGTLEKEPT